MLTHDSLDVRCLCARHLQDYRRNPHLYVRRKDAYSVIKERFDWCEKYGFEYFVIEKHERMENND